MHRISVHKPLRRNDNPRAAEDAFISQSLSPFQSAHPCRCPSYIAQPSLRSPNLSHLAVSAHSGWPEIVHEPSFEWCEFAWRTAEPRLRGAQICASATASKIIPADRSERDGRCRDACRNAHADASTLQFSSFDSDVRHQHAGFGGCPRNRATWHRRKRGHCRGCHAGWAHSRLFQ